MSLQKKTVIELLARNGPVFRALYSIIQTVPALAKWLVILVFLANLKSWPLAWHFRVFRPVFRIRGQHQLLLWRSIFSSRVVRAKRVDEWLDSITPIGESPLDRVSTFKDRATIDDSDFNGHLSNSSYAKTLDSARFYMALEMFPMFFRSGGWMALGGTHFTFLREIPMLKGYEVRSSVASWDNKWLYVIHRFVSKPNGKKLKSNSSSSNSSHKQNSTPDQAVENILHASLRQPADAAASAIVTPSSSTPNGIGGNTTTQETSTALRAAAASLISMEEPDGAILHTIAVSEVCFKVGRITVPPALAIAANGLSAPPSEFGTHDGSASPLVEYSRQNPPPHWPKAKAVMSIPSGGSTKALKELFTGGWRSVPESERWWDQALSGVVEQRRKARLEVVGVLRSGMEGAKALISI